MSSQPSFTSVVSGRRSNDLLVNLRFMVYKSLTCFPHFQPAFVFFANSQLFVIFGFTFSYRVDLAFSLSLKNGAGFNLYNIKHILLFCSK